MEIKLDDWQKKILSMPGKIVFNTGRKVGKTAMRKMWNKYQKEKKKYEA